MTPRLERCPRRGAGRTGAYGDAQRWLRHPFRTCADGVRHAPTRTAGRGLRRGAGAGAPHGDRPGPARTALAACAGATGDEIRRTVLAKIGHGGHARSTALEPGGDPFATVRVRRSAGVAVACRLREPRERAILDRRGCSTVRHVCGWRYDSTVGALLPVRRRPPARRGSAGRHRDPRTQGRTGMVVHSVHRLTQTRTGPVSQVSAPAP